MAAKKKAAKKSAAKRSSAKRTVKKSAKRTTTKRKVKKSAKKSSKSSVRYSIPAVPVSGSSRTSISLQTYSVSFDFIFLSSLDPNNNVEELKN